MNQILLIDDERAMRETLADCLDNAGHDVEQVDNGKTALRLIRKGSYDLIIMDVFMPEMDGIELIQALRELEDHPPIITISGGGGVLPPSWATKITEIYGVKSALTKPIDIDYFLGTVEEALKRANTD